VKAAIVGDGELFRWMASESSPPTARWLERAAEVKANVVETDPDDLGARQVLNFGHTLGHAFEKASHFRLTHGEAISIGMVMETQIAEAMGLADKGLADQVACVLRRLGLPTDPKGIDVSRVMRAIKLDKKRAEHHLTFALPVQVGQVQHGLAVPEAILSNELAPLRKAS